MLFKRGSNAQVIKDAKAAVTDDEEKLQVGSGLPPAKASNSLAADAAEEAREARKEQPKMTDVFSWKDLNYTVPVPGGHRKLLDDVSGYVAPGKLTALMGESGAGKVHIFTFLCLTFPDLLSYRRRC